MNIDLRRRLFVGLKMDAAMRSDLAHISPANRRYLDDPGFLSVCQSDDDKYIGKTLDAALPIDQFDDIRRNVVSILARIFPERKVHSAVLRVFATTDVVETPVKVPADDSAADDV